MWSFTTITACLMPLVLAAPATLIPPSVTLDYATIVGSSLLGVDSFKGIPYAQPPVKQLRLRPPQAITANLGTIQAVGLPMACPQSLTSTNTSSLPAYVVTELIDSGILQTALQASEDCLTLNVQRPSTAKAGSKLPVVFWIYGGAFEAGFTYMYDGTKLISTAMAQNQDIIYVAVNYRLGGHGWLAGKELKAEGSTNLGLLDQRAGLKWVADNIAAFGGDPDRVTLWGESAGSISVFDQMVLYGGDHTYKGKPLFHGAIMDSGSIVPATPVDAPRAQGIYDAVVHSAGCSSASDTLACLRSLDPDAFHRATTSVPSFLDYSSVALSYPPRPDGVVLTDSPDILIKNGQFAPVPFIIGDQEDEGTLFSLVQSNLSTTADVVTYLEKEFFLSATHEQMVQLVATYPDDPAAGSPFRTGLLNIIYPQFKRMAAILGDLVFTLTRRVFLDLVLKSKPTVPFWSYLSTYAYSTPVLGTFHASDILVAYGTTPGIPSSTIMQYYINFINNLDPNKGASGLANWPQWKENKELLEIGSLGTSYMTDDFRNESYAFISSNVEALRL